MSNTTVYSAESVSVVLAEEYIAVLTIDRPKAMNALSSEVLTELTEALNAVEAYDPEIRALIITGGGDRAFVAGADIAQMYEMTAREAQAYALQGNLVMRKIENLRCPVIAAVHGFALGGGMELALACGMRYASEQSRFAAPEVGLGILPGFGGTQRLARAIGYAKANEMVFTAKQVDAQYMYENGMLNGVLPDQESVMAAAMKLAQEIAVNAPVGVALAKEAINTGMETDIDSGIRIEAGCFGRAFATEDQTIGMRNFLEKRGSRKNPTPKDPFLGK